MEGYNETELWKELLKAAGIIDRWSATQRKDYLINLCRREKIEGKTFFRNIIKLMLSDTKRRKGFIKAAKSKMGKSFAKCS